MWGLRTGSLTGWVLAVLSVSSGTEVLGPLHAPQMTTEADSGAALEGYRIWLNLGLSGEGKRARSPAGAQLVWLRENVR